MQCTYFARDGHCSKGQYCPFLHVKGVLPSVCKNYLNASGCRFGSSCAFLHDAKSRMKGVGHPLPSGPDVMLSNRAPLRETKDNIDQKITVVARSDEEPMTSLDVEIETPMIAPLDAGHSHSNWSFDPDEPSNSSNVDGVYFYGASGTGSFHDSSAKSKSSESIWNKKKREGHTAFSPLLGNDDQTKSKSSTTFDHKETFCPFYMNSDCKFGSKCRYQHESGENNGEDIDGMTCIDSTYDQKEEMKNEKSENDISECNICMSLPDQSNGEVYGIMSNCTCVFCLHCIREWRNEGLKNPKKLVQIRMCPTCRVNSYFVIPSAIIVRGKSKDDLISRYKESLSQTPCKVGLIIGKFLICIIELFMATLKLS